MMSHDSPDPSLLVQKQVPSPDMVDGPTVKPPESQLTSREEGKVRAHGL